MSLARLEATERDGVLVACLEGEIDLSNARSIRSSLLSQMRNDLLGLVVDLTDVGYLDSVGIQVIYQLHKQLDGRRQEMRLVVPEGSTISKTLKLVGACSVMGIARTAELALSDLCEREAAS